MTGALVAYRWELRKLVSQKRTYIGIGAAALLPVVFVTVMALQKGGPYDAPLGHNLRRTGLASGGGPLAPLHHPALVLGPR